MNNRISVVMTLDVLDLRWMVDMTLGKIEIIQVFIRVNLIPLTPHQRSW